MPQAGFQMTFRHMEPSAALRSAAEKELERWSQDQSGPTRCHVTVEQPHAKEAGGHMFRVHVHMHDCGRSFDGESEAHGEDPYGTMHEAFGRLSRQRERARGRRKAI